MRTSGDVRTQIYFLSLFILFIYNLKRYKHTFLILNYKLTKLILHPNPFSSRSSLITSIHCFYTNPLSLSKKVEELAKSHEGNHCLLSINPPYGTISIIHRPFFFSKLYNAFDARGSLIILRK